MNDKIGISGGDAHRPRVSISMITFRHEKWVGEAIESVLNQDLDDWEIVLGDDLSDDGTMDVIRSYEERCMGPFGQRLRLLPHDVKLGPRQNYMRTLRACRGEYTAQLDGDDWFTDEQKLSKQVRFLDERPDFSGVFGAWLETDENGDNGVLTPGFGIGDQTRFSAADFGAYCKTTSVVSLFRTDLFGDFPDWYTEADVGDWPLHVLNLMHGGDYGYIPEVLAAHRNHGAGVWTKRSAAEQARCTTRMHDLFKRVLPADLAKAMIPSMTAANFGRGRGAVRSGDYESAVVFLEWVDRHREVLAEAKVPRFKLWRALRRARKAAKLESPAG